MRRFRLLLWKTPPGLELILAQEGVAFETVKDPHPLSFRGGRFVLFDSRRSPSSCARRPADSDHVAIDIDALRRGEPVDPFAALIDQQAARGSWPSVPWTVSERVARFPKAWIRRRLIDKLRRGRHGGRRLWVRLAPFPYPYRSAFSFRADLDEPVPEDYHRFATARAPLADCCTHFVSTHAYAHHAGVLSDLRPHDTQSHGHFHHVYRDPEANRVNLERAAPDPPELGLRAGRLRRSARPLATEPRRPLEDLGYLYSSDFQLGYDDFPFYPWKGNRFSRVLQIPVHPVCEGLFLEAGVDDPGVIGDYFRQVVAVQARCGRARRRLRPSRAPARPDARGPDDARPEAIENQPLVWRATFTELARWWRWRAERRWLVIPREDHRLEIQFDEWDTEYDFALEIHRGRFQLFVARDGSPDVAAAG